MLSLSERGDNSQVDMLVGDIYGSDYSKIGLKSSTIASSFGKVFQKGPRSSDGGGEGQGVRRKKAAWKQEDLAKSLLYAVSNNIGQIACVPLGSLPWRPSLTAETDPFSYLAAT
jgi:type II pantothenate kinase